MNGRKIVVLLGAGASVDAGGPTSVELVECVRHLLADEPDVCRIYDFVVAGCSMRSAWTESGRANIEDVANSVAALCDRRSNELAPFVSGWHPFVEGLFSKRPVSENAVDELATLLQSQFMRASEASTDIVTMDWYRYANRIIELSRAETLIEPGLITLRDRMPSLVSRAVSEAVDRSRVGYLAPLSQLSGPFLSGHSIVATLNYDNALEYAFESNDVPYVDALDMWRVGGEVDLSCDRVLMLKLHGSVSWERHNEHQVTREEPGIVANAPEIVFGGHNKMRSDGPYLSMLWAWRTALSKANTLVIVGYSFSDDHINLLIDEWLSAERPLGGERTVHVVTYSYNTSSLFERRLIKADQGHVSQLWGPDVRVSFTIDARAEEEISNVVNELVSEGAL